MPDFDSSEVLSFLPDDDWCSLDISHDCPVKVFTWAHRSRSGPLGMWLGSSLQGRRYWLQVYFPFCNSFQASLRTRSSVFVNRKPHVTTQIMLETGITTLWLYACQPVTFQLARMSVQTRILIRWCMTTRCLLHMYWNSLQVFLRHK